MRKILLWRLELGAFRAGFVVPVHRPVPTITSAKPCHSLVTPAKPCHPRPALSPPRKRGSRFPHAREGQGGSREGQGGSRKGQAP